VKKQNFSVGAFVHRLAVVDDLLREKEKLKHRFVITSLFGTFPNVIFNGGRTLVHYHSDIAEKREWYEKMNYLWYDPLGMESLVRSYNERGIGIRYTYSNCLITKRHLGDRRANLTLEIAHNPQNAVITANPVIEGYVRKHYPKFKIVSSVTSPENLRIAFLKKRIGEVDLLVLPPEYNGRYDLIEKLDVDKIEILINERCVFYCRNRQAHYLSISKTQLTWDPAYQSDNYFTRCPVYMATQQGRSPETMVLTDKKIAELQKRGVRNFKFAGRHLSGDEFAAEVGQVLLKRPKDRPA
jgi:collagenase-like PrtC family protease